MPVTEPHRHDVLVIGGGPAGAAAGHWLGRAGRDVVVVEKKTFPREKTCGDGLTPRAVTQLRAMGLEEKIAANHHRYDGLRCVAHGITLEMPWPQHPVHPSHGYVVRRRDLDTMVAEEAAAARRHACCRAPRRCARSSATGCSPARSSRTRPAARSARSCARYVVIADGSLSRFGRALGNQRDKRLPAGHGHPRLLREPAARRAVDRVGPRRARPQRRRHARLRLDLPVRRRHHQRRHRAAVHVPRLARHQHLPPHARVGGHRPASTGASTPTPCSASPPAVGCRWPGRSTPSRGRPGSRSATRPGSINPFNGEGIDYAYETGRMAAELLDEALETGSAMPLARYPDLLEAEYGLYFRVARAFAHVIGQPALMQQLTRVGMQSQSLMEWVLRIMANLLRPDELGPAEAAYRAVAASPASSPSASRR